MTQTSKRPTAADVARRSGVSAATVSYVLNDTPGQKIPEKTRRRVLDAVKALDYVPSPWASSLAKGSSRVAIVDLSEIPYGLAISEFAREIATSLERLGYLPIVDHLDHHEPGRGARLLQLARMLSPEVIVTATPPSPLFQAKLRAAGARRFFSLLPANADFMSVVGGMARAQVDHLVERGHSKIGYAGSDESHLEAADAARRDAVFSRAEELGAVARQVSRSRVPAQIAAALLAARARYGITAVAAYNDEIALSVLSGAAEARLDVPSDLAVIGNDDSFVARACFPPLTSVTSLSAPGPALPEMLGTLLAEETGRLVDFLTTSWVAAVAVPRRST